VRPGRPPPSPLSTGVAWAYRVIAVGLEFAAPALIGHLLDSWWGTSPVAMLVGAVFGFAAGLLHLIRLAHASSSTRPPSDSA